MSLTSKIIQYRSSVVNIGIVPLGGDLPIRLQSMTNTDTLDTEASVKQIIRIVEAGADYVRLTAQGIREAENLGEIKKKLNQQGFRTPLIADIHFNPSAAETAARIVEKVRINPGNYVDKRASFEKRELTGKEYAGELERIHERLLPLIKICKQYGTVIRIGINHGSLSDRIMTKYGNTPAGMVNSALEFISILRAENFNDLVLSMKSSDTSVMIEATRQLVYAMQKDGLSYPLHLGVTEAGEGEDGRVRSASGIGALLAEGIGDTIRVSLSEAPEAEIPVARKLADFYPRGISLNLPDEQLNLKTPVEKPAEFRTINGPLVATELSISGHNSEAPFEKAGYRFDTKSKSYIHTDSSADIVIVDSLPVNVPADLQIAVRNTPVYSFTGSNIHNLYVWNRVTDTDVQKGKLTIAVVKPGDDISQYKGSDPLILIFEYNPASDLYAADRLLLKITDIRSDIYLILRPIFEEADEETLMIKASALLGRYLNDRRIAGISIGNLSSDTKDLNKLSFSILQCTETRITRTMYLSCPTCGRTNFDLQESVQKVKAATSHLKGIKIAVMGCIVNGPGEMAGADYGYVGAGPGKVHIYKGTVPVLKNVRQEDAVAELLKLIEQDKGLV